MYKRNWCRPQLVLPTVYDDELSYYECLGKISDEINNIYNFIHNMGVTSSNIKTVLDYGAVGDGKTPCYNSFIQCALENNIIVIPEGTYLLEQEFYCENRIVIGLNATLINTLTNPSTSCVHLGGNCSIYGISFNTYSKCLKLSGEHNTVFKCYFTTTTIPNDAYAYAIEIINGGYDAITQCEINNNIPNCFNRDGIHINCGVWFVWITDCRIESGDDAIAINSGEGDATRILKNIYVSNCYIWANQGVRIYGFSENRLIRDIYIRDCIIDIQSQSIPCVRITNASGTRGNTDTDFLWANNINITGCYLKCNTDAITIANTALVYINVYNTVTELANNKSLLKTYNSNINNIAVSDIENLGANSIFDLESNIEKISLKNSYLKCSSNIINTTTTPTRVTPTIKLFEISGCYHTNSTVVALMSLLNNFTIDMLSITNNYFPSVWIRTYPSGCVVNNLHLYGNKLATNAGKYITLYSNNTRLTGGLIEHSSEGDVNLSGVGSLKINGDFSFSGEPTAEIGATTIDCTTPNAWIKKFYNGSGWVSL